MTTRVQTVVELGGVDLGTVLPVDVLPAAGEGPHLVETRRLAPCFSSVADARDFSRRVTDRWQVRLIAEDLACVVSELVANALDHGLGLRPDSCPAVGDPADGDPADGDPAPSQAGSPIELQLVRTADRVLCLVSDPATRPPRRLHPDAVRESGRGLQLIDSLSLDWGWVPLARAGGIGKVVWAALAAPAPGTVGRTSG